MTIKIRVKGAVQGVGYRPFVLQKATEYGLLGQVKNIGAAVEIIVSGPEEKIDLFTKTLETDYPAGAFILSVQKEVIDSDQIFSDFKIVESSVVDLTSELPVFLPDIGVCDTCLSEMLDHKNRRHMYPLISCASCGPRISILDSLPYDRDTTTMLDFEMCPECSSEYIIGRRRHAQTISCHDCGPQMILEYFEKDNIHFLDKEDAVNRAIRLLDEGNIIGLKGISGYQLLCKPLDSAAKRLRCIKGRENKPFAIIFSDIQSIIDYAYTNKLEEELLQSSARPIVLLNRKKDLPYEVCKDSDYIGAFLPSAGIHRILCDAVGPLICTSANHSGQPMVIQDEDFKNAFMNPSVDDHVDGVLYHKRRINQPQDDSVMFVVDEGTFGLSSQFIRRARGYVPLPVFCKEDLSDSSILCFGGDLKSTFSLAKRDRIIPSQYIGDLEDADSFELFRKLIERYCKLFSFLPSKVICDRHPLYFSARYAKEYASKNNLDINFVQHHHAHALSVMAENSLHSCIGVAFDGTGYGDDGKVWGGEILLCKDTEYTRVSHLSYVKLMGGDNAPKDADNVKDCYEIALGNMGKEIVKAALWHNINTYETSSVGRLYDAVAALLNIKKYNSFEGECAMALEKLASRSNGEKYPIYMISLFENDQGEIIFDQVDLFDQIENSLKSYEKCDVAYGFHMALVNYIFKVSCMLREKYLEDKICLSGGVFANRILLTRSIDLLTKNGFRVYWNRLVPSGDSGISLGQAYFGLLSKE